MYTRQEQAIVKQVWFTVILIIFSFLFVDFGQANAQADNLQALADSTVNSGELASATQRGTR